MKNTAYVMALAILLASACQKNEIQENEPPQAKENLRVLTVGVADGQQTRVGFGEDNSFYWHSGDRIGVITVNGFKEMTLNDGYHGQATGVFTGQFEEEPGDYVVYPHGAHSMTDGQLTYVLPSSYTYDSIEAEANSFNPPMAGAVDGEKAALSHLASFFKISVSNIPAGGDDMKFIFTADRRITGEFVADMTADTPVIVTDDRPGNTVTINFTNTEPAASGVFYVPAPLGTYGSITAEVRDGDESLVTRTWTDQTVSRKTPKRGTVDIDYVAEINGTVYKSLQEAFDDADNQTVILDRDLEVAEPVVVASGKTAVLDLNGNTLSAVATSSAASRLIAVQSGAALTIRNGSIVYAATTPDTQWGGEGQPPYPGYANNTITNQGELTIEGASLENKTLKGGASYVIDNYSGAKLTIGEGTVIKQSGGDVAIRMFNGGTGEIDVTINGGTITGYRAVWIQLASNNAAVAPVMKLTVNGGTLTSSDTNYHQTVYSYSYGNDMKNVLINVTGGTFNGDIALTGGANKTNLETLNISGGTFNGLYGDFFSYGAEDKALDAITVTGGDFTADPSVYLAPGYEAVHNEGRWSVRPIN